MLSRGVLFIGCGVPWRFTSSHISSPLALGDPNLLSLGDLDLL